MKQGTPWTIDEGDFPAAGAIDEQARFLVGYAVLAPSNHNSQPWRFAVDGARIELFADSERWLPVTDPDQRELHISLGCALENLVIAAEHFGLGHRTEYFPDEERPELVARLTLEPGGEPSPERPPELFDAIVRRHTNRMPFDERPIPEEALERLRRAATGGGIRLFLTEDPEVRQWVERLIADSDRRHFSDPAWRRELGEHMGEGAFGDPWPVAKLGKLLVSTFDLGRATGEKNARTFQSAPVFGLIASLEDDRTSQVRVGQAFERVYLTAESLGLSLQPLSQIAELPEPKTVLSGLLELGAGVAQQPFRLGFGPRDERHPPRRGREEVLVG